MADTVTSRVLFNGTVDYIVQITNRSDGTGESAVVKIDKSTLVGPGGAEPSKLRVKYICYDCNGMGAKLYFDRSSGTTVLAELGSGHGVLNYCPAGGLDDVGSGNTGDVLLTTYGHTSGDSYNIILHCEKVQ